jgi:hypothetical protein
VDSRPRFWFGEGVACCVFVAFLISRVIRGVARLVRPVTARLRPQPATLTPAVVSVSGGRFVRSN